MIHLRSFIRVVLLGLVITGKTFAQSENVVIATNPDTVSVDSIKVDSVLVDSVLVDSALIVAEAPSDTVTIKPKPITFSSDSAYRYLKTIVGHKDLWRNDNDAMKQSLLRLTTNYLEPFDSVRSRLLSFPYQVIDFEQTYIVQRDTLPIRWLNRPYFIIDTVALDKDPVIKHKTIVMRVIDPLSLSMVEKNQDIKDRIESYLQIKDTITEVVIDNKYLESKKVKVYKATSEGITPKLVPRERGVSIKFITDSSQIVISKSFQALVASKDSPFFIIPNDKMTDSLKSAVETLLNYTQNRDSILVKLNNISGIKTPIWLSTGKEGLFRYWVKNSKNDSITVWIGNPSISEISLLLDEDVNVEQIEKKMVDNIPFTNLRPDRRLVKISPLKEIPVYWNYGLLSSYSLTGNYLSNWARGGESAVSSMLDINSKVDYNNKESKIKWINNVRLRYGTTWTEKHKEFRSSIDILEGNSQFNKVLREKVDFSSVLYMRTQVAKGYNYPANAAPIEVSKFLNPGSFTIGAGLEYKPTKKTGLNFSVLSYRNTFVLDTVTINQVAYGIEKDKRSRHEMGGQLMVRNSLTLFKDMEITNSIRLFSNYLKSPKNVDVDWEMGLEKHISWYFKIRLNLHVIYDDDVLFPVKLADGGEKKVPKTQFNPFLGLTLAFKL